MAPPPSTPAPPATDQRVLGGRYRLGLPIGRGGMAEVYAATDLRLERTVAAKLLHPNFRNDPRFIERFLREARAAASLNHPNIVAVYDHGDHEGVPFIVMELVRGRSLADLIRDDGAVSEDRALELAADVCAALEAAHERGIVHRDIKPANVLLGDNGTVKVTDFGIARAIDGDTITQTSLLGTIAYAAPEQVDGRPVDVRTDVYALGVVLYELLTGTQPFRGDTPVAVTFQHLHTEPPQLRTLAPNVSPETEAIVARALAKQPEQRHQSATELLNALATARSRARRPIPTAPRTGALSAATTAVAAPVAAVAVDDARTTAVLPAMEAPRRAGRWPVVAMAALLAVFLGAVAWAATAGRPPPLTAPPAASTATLPSFVGMPLAAAQRYAIDHGLTLELAGGVVTADAATGAVAEQRPPAGAALPTDTVVGVVVAIPPAVAPPPPAPVDEGDDDDDDGGGNGNGNGKGRGKDKDD